MLLGAYYRTASCDYPFWDVSSLGLAWESSYQCSHHSHYEHIISLLLDKYLRMKLLDHSGGYIQLFKKLPLCLTKWSPGFTLPSMMSWTTLVVRKPVCFCSLIPRNSMSSSISHSMFCVLEETKGKSRLSSSEQSLWDLDALSLFFVCSFCFGWIWFGLFLSKYSLHCYWF